MHEFAIVKPVQPPIRAHQHVSVAVLHDGADPSVSETFFQIVIREMRPIPAAESAGSADPQAPIAIFVEGLNPVITQPFRDRKPRCLSFGDSDNALVRSTEPPRARAVFIGPANSQAVARRRYWNRFDPALFVSK